MHAEWISFTIVANYVYRLYILKIYDWVSINETLAQNKLATCNHKIVFYILISVWSSHLHSVFSNLQIKFL